MAAFSSSLTVFISYFIMSFYEDTSQNAQYSYECHWSVPPPVLFNTLDTIDSDASDNALVML